MTMRKMLAILATLAMLCTVLPLGAIFSAAADGEVILDKNFEDGNAFFTRSVVENGYIVFDATTADWQNTYAYVNALKANTDYVVSFKAKANKDTNMNFKVNDNWGKDAAAVTVDVTTEWQNYEFEINMDSLSTGIVMFSSNSTAAGAAIYYIDDVKIVEGKIADAPVENPDNIVKNGYFTNGIDGWSASGGTVLAPADGALHADFNESWGFINAGTYTLKANTNYVLTFKAKSINGSGVTPKMNKADWSGTVVEKGMNFTAEWADYEWAFTTTDVTSLMLFFQSGCDASTGQEVWLDDVVLLEVAGSEPEVPASDNLIVNGDFETGDNTGWEKWQSTTISADAAKDGAYGAHLKGNGSWGGMLNQTVAVEAGKQYKLSFWINVNANGVNVQVKDGSGASIEGAGGWFDSNKKDTQVEWTFTATDGSVLINFCGAGNNTAEDVYVDNLSLVAIDNGDDDALIKNGGFENEMANWENLWGSCTVSFVEGYNSSKAISIVAGSWAQVRQLNIPVEANTDYELSAMVKDIDNFGLIVKNGDDSGDIANVLPEKSSEWAKASFTFNTGDQTVIRVLLIGWEGGGSGIIDDVVLTKVGGETPDTPDQPDVPVTPPAGDVLNATFDGGEMDGMQSSSDVSVVDGALQFNITADWGNVYSYINVEANTDYTVSFRAKSKLGKSIWVKFNNNWGPDVASADASIGTEWKDYSVTLNSGDCTSLILLMQYNGYAADGETMWFDYIVITKAGETPVLPPVSGDGLLSEDFEDALSDDWTLATKGNSGIVDGAMKLEGNAYEEILTSPVIALKKGVTYTVSFDIKLISSGEINFQVKNCYEDNPSRGNSILDQYIRDAVAGSWKNYSFSFKNEDLPRDFASLLFVNNSGTDFYVDNIVVSSDEQPVVPDEPTSGIVNGGFENGSEGWELGSSASITEDDAHSGKASLKLEDPGMWSAAAVQNVPVKPNTEYVVEMWINRIKGTTPFNLYMMDAADNRNLEVVEGQNWFNTATPDWEKRTIVINTGAATEIVLKWSSEAANAGIMLVDDMSIYEKNAPQPSAGLVQDPGFESGELNSNIMPGGVSGAWYNVWGSCVATFDTPGYDGSNYALSLEIATKWSHTRQDKIPVKPNTDYVVWARVKNTTGMSIVMKDGNDTVGITNDEQGAIPEDMTNTWMLHKLEFNSGSYDSVCLLLIAIAETGGMGTFDDVQIYEKGKEPTASETYPIKNAGFESGELDPNTAPGGVTGAWYNLWGACTYSFETPGHDKSNFALSIEAPNDWQQIRQDGVPVEPNTDYTLIAYVKNPINYNVVVKTANDAANIADFGVENDMSNQWIRLEIPFNSGSETAVCVLLIGNDAGPSSAVFDNVQIYKKGEEPAEPEPDAPATEGPMQLDYFGVAINRPANENANLILNGSFENAEGGQWQSIISDTLYVVDDETAPEGNKSLFFNTSGVKDNNKVIFYLDVEPNTDYVFSAWVKGAYISADNRFNATFGVTDWKDNFCVYADSAFSNKLRQIVPTAWDNDWHLRSVQFNSGANIKVGIGFAGAESQMWIDGIALYTVEDGIKYADPKTVGYIMPNTLEKNEGACADEHNLIADSTMGSADAQEFWASAEGFKNGFLTFPENEYEYGTSLKYTGNDDSCYTHAIKWFTVEPNTDYTFSVDLRVVKTGGGSLTLLDGKLRDCTPFLLVDFDQDAWGTGWKNVTVKFNTGVFDRIGIAIVDGGGEALLDNMRLFKSEYTIEGGVEDDYIEPPYSFDDPTDPEDPDSPATGVSVMGAVLAVALVPASAAAAFKLRRKKEDEE